MRFPIDEKATNNSVASAIPKKPNDIFLGFDVSDLQCKVRRGQTNISDLSNELHVFVLTSLACYMFIVQNPIKTNCRSVVAHWAVGFPIFAVYIPNVRRVDVQSPTFGCSELVVWLSYCRFLDVNIRRQYKIIQHIVKT